MAELVAVGGAVCAAAKVANKGVKAATGRSIARHCRSAAKGLRNIVLQKAGEKLSKEAEERLFNQEERAEFERRLGSLETLLERVASNPAADDPSVIQELLGLQNFLEGATARYGEERADVLNAIAQRMTSLDLALTLKTTDGIDEIKAGVQQLLANEGTAQERFVYDPYNSDDSDQEESLLGEGSFGATHKMRNKEDGCVYAVKLMKIKKTGVGVEKLREEAARLSMLNHPNIVRYFTAFRFKKNRFFAIAMEYLTGGSLLARIEQERGPLTSGQRQREVQTEQWAGQVASALAHMHARRMQHRDLKPDNVLFDEFGAAKIIDLGLAAVVKAKSCVSSAGGANKVGALMYQSPEKAMGRAYDGKDDVWALGCMLGGAVTGKLVEARSTGVFALDSTAVKALVDETNAASAKFGGLVAAMLKHNPSARPAAQDVERHLLPRGQPPSTSSGCATIVEEEDDESAAERGRRAAEAKASPAPPPLPPRLPPRLPDPVAPRPVVAPGGTVTLADGTVINSSLFAAPALPQPATRRPVAPSLAVKTARSDEGKRTEKIDLSKIAELRTLKGHSESVRCVAVFPDGRRVVSGTGYPDKTLKVLDVATGECVATLEGHSNYVNCVAVFPDGRRVVSGAGYPDKTLKVWDVATGKCLATLQGHSNSVNSVAVFPDGRRVVSGSYDNTLKVWDVATGKCLATLQGHSNSVNCVAISPDGRRVVSASQDYTLKVWDVATGECVATLEGHSSAVWSVAVFPDGRRFVSGSGDETLKVWDLATGKCLATLEGHSMTVECVAVFPDGRRVVSCDGGLSLDTPGVLKVWDVATGKCVATLEGHSGTVYSVAVFPDGRRVVSASHDKTLKLWGVPES